MRDSLKKSAADSPVRGFEKYRKDSVVLCNACALPIFKLDRSICLGDGAGRTASALVPLSVADLRDLAVREDIDAGVRGTVRMMSSDQMAEHAGRLHGVRAGDPMVCPACGNCFVQVLAIERHEVLDKAYTIELLTIPPAGAGTPAPVRGRRLGAMPGKDWLH